MMNDLADRVRGVFGKKPTPQEVLRDWQRRLRSEARNIERQVRDVQREEKNVQKSIREAVLRNDTKSAKILAKELVRSRKAVEKLYEGRSQMNSISLHLGQNVALAKAMGHIVKSTEVMKLVNGLMKNSEMAPLMRDLEHQLVRTGVIDEIIREGIDSVVDQEDMDDEIETEVDKVLHELAGEAVAEMPSTSSARRERLKQKQQVNVQRVEEQPIAVLEGGDDEGELEDLRARLDNVRS